MAGERWWNKKAARPEPQAFNCPHCGGTVEIRAAGHTLNVACSSCGSLLDATDPNYKILQTFKNRAPITPLIPLGTRGRLQGSKWEVIGFMVRSDSGGDYKYGEFLWREYLLFNPTMGFQFLMEANGHWNLIKITKNKPKGKLKDFGEGGKSDIVHLNRKFNLFHKGVAHVKYVLGEFYWRVKVGDVTEVMDFVDPPDLLSSEKNDEEIIWSTGRYIPQEQIKDAFKIKEEMPRQEGLAPNQPSEYAPILNMVGKHAIIFFICLAIIQILGVVRSKNQLVLNNVLPYDSKKTMKDLERVSDIFELKHGTANVEIKLMAAVKNNWLETSIELINEKTGDAWGFDQGVEYYYGSDWSEGSRSNTRIIPAVPAGEYRLKVRPVHNKRLPNMSYTVQLRRDVILWANFNTAFLLIFSVLAYYLMRDHMHKVQRWSTSDYSPYQTEAEWEWE